MNRCSCACHATAKANLEGARSIGDPEMAPMLAAMREEHAGVEVGLKDVIAAASACALCRNKHSLVFEEEPVPRKPVCDPPCHWCKQQQY